MSEPSPYAQRIATGSIVLAAATGILSILYFLGLPISIAAEDNLVIAAFCLGAVAGLAAVMVTLYQLVRRRKISTRMRTALASGLAALGLGYYTLSTWIASMFSWVDSIYS